MLTGHRATSAIGALVLYLGPLARQTPAFASAGMRVVAIPNRQFPPDDEALALVDVALDSLDELEPEVIDAADRG